MTDRPLTRAEWVDRELRSAIIRGDFQPGQKLVTEQLAERWSVSPTPLRESYPRLAAEGLLEVTPQRGVRVAPASLDEARDIYAIRHVLEPHALELSLANRDEDWVAELERAYTELRRHLEGGIDDLLQFENAHRAFHTALLSRCGSPWLLRIVRILQDHSVRYRLMSIGPRGGEGEVLREHDDLFTACIGDDIEAAVERLDRHIRLTIDSLDREQADQADQREEP